MPYELMVWCPNQHYVPVTVDAISYRDSSRIYPWYIGLPKHPFGGDFICYQDEGRVMAYREIK